jgi:hypothetical protein
MELAVMLAARRRGNTSGGRAITTSVIPAILIGRRQCTDYRDCREKLGHRHAEIYRGGILLNPLDLAVARRFSGFIAIGSAHVAPVTLFPNTGKFLAPEKSQSKRLLFTKLSLCNKLVRLRALSDTMTRTQQSHCLSFYVSFHQKHVTTTVKFDNRHLVPTSNICIHNSIKYFGALCLYPCQTQLSCKLQQV